MRRILQLCGNIFHLCGMKSSSSDQDRRGDMVEDWSQLPSELLQYISSYLNGKDIISFHRVCKSWHVDEFPKNPYRLWHVSKYPKNPLEFPASQSQWLLHKRRGYTTHHYFHPFFGDDQRYSQDFVEQASDAMPRFSKDSWILMSSGDYNMFFFNPFTDIVIQLPNLPEKYDFMGVYFTSIPTSPECAVVAISGYFGGYVKISILLRGRDRWYSRVYKNNMPFNLSFGNPVFHNDMLYCFGTEGNLGIFNFEEDADHEWTVLSNPQIPCKGASEKYVLNFENELMSVFWGLSRSWVSVFRFKESNMVWEEVNDLGDYALFLSATTAFARKGMDDLIKNKIFLPIFSDNYVVFYSLETRKFHTFGSNLCKKDLEGTKIAVQFESCWIEPQVITYSQKELDWTSKI